MENVVVQGVIRLAPSYLPVPLTSGNLPCRDTLAWSQECSFMTGTTVFTGNKSDRVNQREIPAHIAERFAQQQDMRFLETSAKESDNVKRLFLEIAKELTQQARDNEICSQYSSSTDLVSVDTSPIGNFGCCKGM